MYDEDDLLPLSALAQLAYCERRAALIHIEGLWGDNVFTVEGTDLHAKADTVGHESRPGVRIARAVPLRSLRLGLSGKADVIEFLSTPEGLVPYPVDYKRGRLPKHERECWAIQLCAQALCLEEMLAFSVPAGAIYYGASRRRWEVVFTPELRARTEEAAGHLHRLFDSQQTPKAAPGPKCEKCSLHSACLPEAATFSSAAAYVENVRQREESVHSPPRNTPEGDSP
ncbi:MAG: CRISPR-associated protein Cas4 [Pseudomonadota bacterium]